MVGAPGTQVQLPCVLLEIEVPAEPFSADAACEGFPLVVRVHVEGQVVDLVEGFVADAAFVRLLPAVGQSVVLVVAFLVEPFTTELADERLVTSMDPGMSVESRRSVKRFPASQTFVWLF